jgi:hypothetical protein
MDHRVRRLSYALNAISVGEPPLLMPGQSHKVLETLTAIKMISRSAMADSIYLFLFQLDVHIGLIRAAEMQATSPIATALPSNPQISHFCLVLILTKFLHWIC